MTRIRCVTLKQPNRQPLRRGQRPRVPAESNLGEPRAALHWEGVIMGHEGPKSESRVNSIVFRLTSTCYRFYIILVIINRMA